jgi:hypothetical protein
MPSTSPAVVRPPPFARNRVATLVGLACCAATLLPHSSVDAQEFRLHLEPAVAIPLDQPQTDRFDTGFMVAVRPSLSFGRVFAVQWSYAFLFLPVAKGFNDNGSGHFVTAGLRLRPFGTLFSDAHPLGGLFVDGNVGWVHTGDIDRPAFDAGLGYTFQVTRNFALGPAVRYTQIIQRDNRADEDPDDAQILSVGINFTLGTAARERVEPICPTAAECPVYTPVECVQDPCPILVGPPAACLDADADGVCDIDDRCPAVPGPAVAFGCPIDPCSGEPLHLLVQFAFDSSALPQRRNGDPTSMDPVLEEVANAIARDTSCRVCIMGHTSLEGDDAYNEQLSRERAQAVQGYLSQAGLESSRLPATGMGERCQLNPVSSLSMNRRVEFIRLDEGESCPTSCTE